MERNGWHSLERYQQTLHSCLEARNALEKLDLEFILASVPEADRMKIMCESRIKHGISRANKQVGILKERYQLFFKAVSEVIELNTVVYDLKQSHNFQSNLSFYIHSYHLTDEQIKFSSPAMSAVPNLIGLVDKFIKKSCNYDGITYLIGSFQIHNMPSEDKTLLDKWKSDTSFKYDRLVEELRNNHRKRNRQAKEAGL